LLRPGTAALRNGRLRPAAVSPIGAPASGTVRRRPFSTSRAGRPALRFMDSFGVAAAHRSVHPPQYGYGGRALRQREWFLKTRDMDVLFQGVALGCPVPGFQRVLWRVTHKKRRGAFIFMMSSEFGQVEIAIQVNEPILRRANRNATKIAVKIRERFSSTTDGHRWTQMRKGDNGTTDHGTTGLVVSWSVVFAYLCSSMSTRRAGAGAAGLWSRFFASIVPAYVSDSTAIPWELVARSLAVVQWDKAAA